MLPLQKGGTKLVLARGGGGVANFFGAAISHFVAPIPIINDQSLTMNEDRIFKTNPNCSLSKMIQLSFFCYLFDIGGSLIACKI